MILLFQENPTSADPAIIVRGWRFEAHLSKILTFFFVFYVQRGTVQLLIPIETKIVEVGGG